MGIGILIVAIGLIYKKRETINKAIHIAISKYRGKIMRIIHKEMAE